MTSFRAQRQDKVVEIALVEVGTQGRLRRRALLPDQHLAELGMRTTKTVWPFKYEGGFSHLWACETLEDPAYLDFVLARALSHRLGYDEVLWDATRNKTCPLGISAKASIRPSWPALNFSWIDRPQGSASSAGLSTSAPPPCAAMTASPVIT